MQILADVINDLAGAARPVEVKLFGESLDTLEAYARRLAPDLAKIAGVEDLYNGVSEPTAELLMRVNQAEADRVDLTPVDVGNAVAAALLGVPAGEVRVEDRPVAVRVRAPDSVRFDPLRLTALPIVAARGAHPTPLGSLASFAPTESRLALDRENQQQMIALTADVSGRSLGGVMGDVRRVLAAHPAPPGVRVALGGQYAGQQEAFRALLLVLALAAVSVCAVMVVQFESFAEPLVVLLVAPVSFVGALALLLATGTVLNVSSFMGLILLVGLIVKNGIILLDFTKLRMRTAGARLETAIREAARVRLRPILMTTLCTLFGLLPLALGIGAGSGLPRPPALAAVEALEHMGELLGRDADPRVRNERGGPAVLRRHVEAHAAARLGELHRVVQHNQQELAHERGLARDLRLLECPDFQLHALLLGEGPDRVHRLGGDVVQVEG